MCNWDSDAPEEKPQMLGMDGSFGLEAREGEVSKVSGIEISGGYCDRTQLMGAVVPFP